MSDENNVISIQIARKKYDQEKCNHWEIIVDEELWMIECAGCGAQLDPIGYLIKLAKEESVAEWRIARLQREEKRLARKLNLAPQQETREE